MKILISGFLVLFSWSALSTHLYVCVIKGLCKDRENIVVNTVSLNNAYTSDTLNNTLAGEPEKLPGSILLYFAFDKSDFTPDITSVTGLKESMTYLNQNAGASLSITGFTDAVGSDEYNLALGYRRSGSVQNYFLSKGVPSEKILVVSKGEKEPAEDNGTSAGRAKNRRAVISVKN
jgi:outer membrane protein OmpA-like peptidoglycan-associated protein